MFRKRSLVILTAIFVSVSLVMGGFVLHAQAADAQIDLPVPVIRSYGEVIYPGTAAFDMPAIAALSLGNILSDSHPAGFSIYNTSNNDSATDFNVPSPGGSEIGVTIVSSALVGDLNKDGVVEFEDLMRFSLAWGHKSGDYGWAEVVAGIYGSPFSQADIGPVIGVAPNLTSTSDGKVNFEDLMVLTLMWNRHAESAQDYVNQAWNHYKAGEYQEALIDASEAIRIDPQRYEAYTIRGGSYLRLNQDAAALEDFNRAIEINPNYAEAYNGRGWCYYGLGQFSAAISEFNKAINLYPEYVDALVGRGWSYVQLGNKTQACYDFQLALVINPYNTAAQQGLTAIGVTYTCFQAGSNMALKDGQAVEMDVPLFVESETILVPIRCIAEGLDANAQWLSDTQTIILDRGTRRVTMCVGSKSASYNGSDVVMKAAPKIVQGRTFIPAFNAAEGLGFLVYMDPDRGTLVATMFK